MTCPRRNPKLKTVVAALFLALTAVPALAQTPNPTPIPRRGDYLPAEVIQGGPKVDYAGMHLRKPPAGYGWYQIGHSYVMASVATGLIVEVVVL